MGQRIIWKRRRLRVGDRRIGERKKHEQRKGKTSNMIERKLHRKKNKG